MTKEQKELVLILCKQLDSTVKFDYAHESEILDWIKDEILKGLEINKKYWKISSTNDGLILYLVYMNQIIGEIALIGDLGSRYPSRRNFGLKNMVCRGRDCQAVEEVIQKLEKMGFWKAQ